jgi:hypothetical protein
VSIFKRKPKPTLVTRNTDSSGTYASSRTMKAGKGQPKPIIQPGKHAGKGGKHAGK